LLRDAAEAQRFAETVRESRVAAETVQIAEIIKKEGHGKGGRGG
jgi:hypothetical protein